MNRFLVEKKGRMFRKGGIYRQGEARKVEQSACGSWS